jgi:excisionase family DNA binding protein
MPRAKTNASHGANRTAKTLAASGVAPSRPLTSTWPEVLTLAEAAAYLRVPDAELARMAGSQGLPGRLVGSEWRFSRAAIQDWLRRSSMKQSLLQLAGSWKDDPYLDEMLKEIYRQRGRPITEEGK